MSITLFINNIVIPFLFGLALLFFIWNVFRFFILGKNNEPDKESARRLAIYSVGAFVFLVSLWGIINLLINGLNLGSNNYVTPDFIEQSTNSTQYRCINGQVCMPDHTNPGRNVCFGC